ncbi:hypothetical protein [Nostoc phage A1]|nr:hypothetical protein [Nostoc phage A1]
MEDKEQIKIQMDTKGFLKIEGKISPQSKEIISQAMQQAEYYRLKTAQENKSVDDQTTVIVVSFMLLLTFMIWSVSNKIGNSFKQQNTTEINYVR